MDTHGEYTWQIRSSECGANGVASLPAVMNLLQEAASLNAETLGFSKSDFAAQGENISWVLTRMRVKIDRYPRWEESIKVVTWPRGGRKITAYRDFEIFDAQGVRIGFATSEWMIINLATRRIVPIAQKVFDLANTERPAVFGAEPFSRLRWDCSSSFDTSEFRARRYHIDLNGHVNNVHYIEWLLECVPQEWSDCRELEIVFKSETLAGEVILGECVEVAPGEFAERLFAPSGADHVLARALFRKAPSCAN